ncbi:hypothetical protein HGB07_01580 [Candidatus Roizmanbacteria bacterium]|nr:hypothetical protein [Candidatus Roizmanbacteria bacterium]
MNDTPKVPTDEEIEEELKAEIENQKSVEIDSEDLGDDNDFNELSNEQVSDDIEPDEE